jgi:radical SAM superfamily enzyme YgiQ (UPF0313 family)
MPDIVLSTLNAKYIHTAFGLRYLMANLGPLQAQARLLEFDIHQRPSDIVETLVAQDPKIVGFGIYVWNVAPITQVVSILKRLRPDILIILGGPEVSFEAQDQTIATFADYIIQGEADLTFTEVCRELLAGRRPAAKILSARLPELSQLSLPYSLYGNEDIARRVIYVEASRGCPFNCEFCLSSLDIPVRQAPLPVFLDHMQMLLDRGAKQLKFVDRTFNLNIDASRTILEFLLARWKPGNFFHFELVPDRLPEPLRKVIVRFPKGALQFEVGVQTFNETVGELIQRRQNYQRLQENLSFLRTQTGVHIHADLIAGLPGETLDSFAAGFDRLLALGPQEIQVGILKRLRGAPIARHDTEWRMVYNPQPPYDILQNRLIDFPVMQSLKRFARYWDLVSNSGNFAETAPLIWSGNPSPFRAFMRWSHWLHARIGRTDGIALPRLMELLFDFLIQELGADEKLVAGKMWRDYQGGGRSDKPIFLREFLPADTRQETPRRQPPTLPVRQRRHIRSQTE